MKKYKIISRKTGQIIHKDIDAMEAGFILKAFNVNDDLIIISFK